jgi:chromosome segregation ATPase
MQPRKNFSEQDFRNYEKSNSDFLQKINSLILPLAAGAIAWIATSFFQIRDEVKENLRNNSKIEKQIADQEEKINDLATKDDLKKEIAPLIEKVNAHENEINQLSNYTKTASEAAARNEEKFKQILETIQEIKSEIQEKP